jgi:hypothetical protein
MEFTNKRIKYSLEALHCSILIACIITSILSNYVPFSESVYTFKNDTKEYGYALKVPISENITYSKCSKLTQKMFRDITGFIGTGSLGKFVKAQYWICFLLLCVIKVFSWFYMSKSFWFKIGLVIVKMLFSPSTFIVLILDYKASCIYIGVPMFFLNAAIYANIALYMSFILGILCRAYTDYEWLTQFAGILFLAYIGSAIVLYFAVYWGPLVTILENVILLASIIIDFLITYYFNEEK